MILAMKSVSNNKSSGNGGLTKEFYETFWEELKQPYMNSLNQAKFEQKNGHMPKASSNTIIRKEGQR